LAFEPSGLLMAVLQERWSVYCRRRRLAGWVARSTKVCIHRPL